VTITGPAARASELPARRPRRATTTGETSHRTTRPMVFATPPPLPVAHCRADVVRPDNGYERPPTRTGTSTASSHAGAEPAG
jgi:hypothetical protein